MGLWCGRREPWTDVCDLMVSMVWVFGVGEMSRGQMYVDLMVSTVVQ